MGNLGGGGGGEMEKTEAARKVILAAMQPTCTYSSQWSYIPDAYII